MTNADLIRDHGLLNEQNDFNASFGSSYETIENALRTIKEYRVYTSPDSPTWQDYILETFHILGFQTFQKAPRLIALNEFGAADSVNALVLLLQPDDNFHTAVPGVEWALYLLYAANYYHATWGIITNGLSIKVFDFKPASDTQVYFEANFEEIIHQERTDLFISIYKVFSLIKNGNRAPALAQYSGNDITQENVGAKGDFYRGFFAELLQGLKSQRPGLTQASKTLPQNWFSFSSGRSGFPLGWVLPREPVLRTELYIDVGDYSQNKEFFDALFSQKDEIEHGVGTALNWERLDGRRASRISISIPFTPNDSPETQEAAKRWGVEMMIKFNDVFRPIIKYLLMEG